MLADLSIKFVSREKGKLNKVVFNHALYQDFFYLKRVSIYSLWGGGFDKLAHSIVGQ